MSHQGTINIKRTLDGLIEFTLVSEPSFEVKQFIVREHVAFQIVQAILHELGGEVIFADPGQSVIRPPGLAGNGNGAMR